MSNGRRGVSFPAWRPPPSSRASTLRQPIRARLAGDTAPRPFRYRHDGDLATIGKRAAAIDFGWIKLTGRLAWWIWGVAHIYFLIGLRNRLTVSLSWLWIYVTGQRSARLITQGDADKMLTRRLARGTRPRSIIARQTVIPAVTRCLLDLRNFGAKLVVRDDHLHSRSMRRGNHAGDVSPDFAPFLPGGFRRRRRPRDAASVFRARAGQPGASQDHGNHRHPCEPAALRLLCRQAERHDGAVAYRVADRGGSQGSDQCDADRQWRSPAGQPAGRLYRL